MYLFLNLAVDCLSGEGEFSGNDPHANRHNHRIWLWSIPRVELCRQTRKPENKRRANVGDVFFSTDSPTHTANRHKPLNYSCIQLELRSQLQLIGAN